MRRPPAIRGAQLDAGSVSSTAARPGASPIMTARPTAHRVVSPRERLCALPEGAPPRVDRHPRRHPLEHRGADDGPGPRPQQGRAPHRVPRRHHRLRAEPAGVPARRCSSPRSPSWATTKRPSCSTGRTSTRRRGLGARVDEGPAQLRRSSSGPRTTISGTSSGPCSRSSRTAT